MARRRSYTAKANRGKAGEVFFNNLLVGSTAKERKEREAKQRRLQKEKDRRERERQKVVVIANRVKLELEKLGFFPGDDTAFEIATRAVEANVTAAKAKSYFIDGNENTIASKCAKDLLKSRGFPSLKFSSLPEYEELEDLVRAYRPQSDVTTTPEFWDAERKLESRKSQLERRESEERERREKEQRKLVSRLSVAFRWVLRLVFRLIFVGLVFFFILFILLSLVEG